MKSIIIQVCGERTQTNIEIIAKQLGITSDKEMMVLKAIQKLYKDKTFTLTNEVKSVIITQIAGKTTPNHLKVICSRLVKRNGLIRNKGMIGMHPNFKDVENTEQIVIRVI